MIYQYKTSYCTFLLKQLSGGEWGIFIGGDFCLTACRTIKAAIDDINCGVTGCEEWDEGGYLEEQVPDAIEEWERIG